MEEIDWITPTGDTDDTVYSSPLKKKIGLILDVNNENLDELIGFRYQEEGFFSNFFRDLNADVITLINGNEKIPYFELENFLSSSTSSLNSYSSNNRFKLGISSFINSVNFISKGKSISEVMSEEGIEKRIKNGNKNFKFISSDTMEDDIYNLKKTINENYSNFERKVFDKFNIKKSSIYSSLNEVLNVFTESGNESKLKYIIIISDGIVKDNFKDIQNIINKAKKNNITIITILLSEKINQKKIYSEFPKHLNKNVKNLFDITSKVDNKNPFVRHFIKKDWDFPEENLGTLFFEANINDMYNKNFTDGIKKVDNSFYEIKIQDLNLKNIIHFKFKFQTKNQIFGTCWANAYAAAIVLANKRVIGRSIETFETYRENIIKYASQKYSDGGNINFPATQNYIENQRLHFKKIEDVEDIEGIINKGKFVICHYFLTKQQWNNFEKFFFDNKTKTGTLTKEIINRNIDPKIKATSGHAVLVKEYNKDHITFLNSWGSNFGDNGTFKVKDLNVFRESIFYDIYYDEEDISEEEKNYYSKNINYIANILNSYEGLSTEKLINHYNNLLKQSFICTYCRSQINIDKIDLNIENDFNVKCVVCHYISEAKGKVRELLVLKNLMHDGNEDFDINYKEKNYIEINRIPLHTNFINNYPNEKINKSDECTLGFENSNEIKIDSIFDKKINSIIWIKNNIFMAGGSDGIYAFEINNNSFKFLMEKNFYDDEILTLCDLKEYDLIAAGGKNLKIFKINYEINYLKLEYPFENDGKINKIILIEKNTPKKIKLLATCDQKGFISIYNIENGKVSLCFHKRYYNSEINCILYIPEDDILVTGSHGDKLKFWEIKEKGLEMINSFKEINSMVSNDCLLDIKGHLLIGLEDGIQVIQHEKRNIKRNDFFSNSEFGGVFSMKIIDDDYFICGREMGFCSIFKMRDYFIRKANIFRNNNLMFIEANEKKNNNFSYKDEYLTEFIPLGANIGNNDLNVNNFENASDDIAKDDYRITSICCAKMNNNKGYILVSSEDKTIKAYTYEILSIK